MPILQAEPSVFPAEMFLAAPPAQMPGVDWWVLHTKPRQEKSLARWLHATGVSFYLPTMTRKCRIRNRVLTAHQPLFTGYVFAHADREHRVSAMSTNRVVRCLPVADQDRLWNDLRQVHQLLSSGLPVATESRLVPGTPVEVISGPLKGVTGRILRMATGNRLVVTVDFIQQGASVLIEDYLLVPTGPPVVRRV